MERKDSVASGITVGREIVVSTGGRDSGYHEKTSLYPPSSVFSIAWSMSGQPLPGCQGTRLEPRGATTQPLRPNPANARRRVAARDGRFAEHLDDDDDDGGLSPEGDLRQLVDFLRLTPPPSNYMSIPDHLSSSDEEVRRRSKLRLFLKRGKSKKRPRPKSITLPDSAVSAKTIGGYRHIAISIPLEYSHFGPDDDPSSQYPVIEPSEPGEIETNLGPMRPRSGERGVVTVLKPVAEDRESICSNPTSPSYRSSQPEQAAALCAPLPPRRVAIPPSDAVRASSIKDFAGTSSTPSPPQKGQSNDPEVESRPEAGPKPLQFTPFGRTVVKKRSKGSPPGRTEPPISRPSSAPPVGAAAESRERVKPLSRSASTRRGKQLETGGTGNTLLTPARARSRSYNGSNYSGGHGAARPGMPRPTGSFAESIITYGSEPRVCDAQTARAYASTPIIMGSPSRSESPINTDFPVPPTTRVDSPSQRDSPARLSTPTGSQSRRERVREKKQRDMMEALKGKTGLRPSRSADWPESLVPGRSSQSSKASLARESPPVATTAAGGAKPKFLHASTLSALGGQPPPGFSGSSDSSLGAPPTTPSHSLTAADRISLHRRKERRAQRESQQVPRKVWAGSTTRSEQQATADSFDSPREKRFREMEKRLQRLEGNSDTWFQSMVPLMENLNKLVQDQHIFQQNLTAFLNSSGLAPPVAPERPQTAMGRLRGGGYGNDLPLRHEFMSRSTSVAHTPRPSTRTGSTHRRPHSIQIPDPGQRTSSLGRGLRRDGGENESSVSSTMYLTPLQAEFEREMAERRAKEARDDAIDARIREAEAVAAARRRQQQQQQQYSGGGGTERRCVVESGGSDSEDQNRITETLQPLMRELQGMTRDSWSRENLQRLREQEEAEESFALF